MINFPFFLYIWILCCFMSLALHKIDAFPEFHFQYRFFFHFWETKNSGFLCTITALNLNTTGSSFVFKKRFSFNKQFFASHDNIYIKMSITEVILLDSYFFLNTVCKLQLWSTEFHFCHPLSFHLIWVPFQTKRYCKRIIYQFSCNISVWNF